tara:strand:+ start:144 stop:290 length:147 start_codon:yes stop_codon:yes gene_type:complete
MNRKEEFVNWMMKIKNIHYSNQEQMVRALENIREYPCELHEDNVHSQS